MKKWPCFSKLYQLFVLMGGVGGVWESTKEKMAILSDCKGSHAGIWNKEKGRKAWNTTLNLIAVKGGKVGNVV